MLELCVVHFATVGMGDNLAVVLQWCMVHSDLWCFSGAWCTVIYGVQ